MLSCVIFEDAACEHADFMCATGPRLVALRMATAKRKRQNTFALHYSTKEDALKIYADIECVNQHTSIAITSFTIAFASVLLFHKYSINIVNTVCLFSIGLQWLFCRRKQRCPFSYCQRIVARLCCKLFVLF